MAHAQKPDFVFRRNGRVHLNRRGRQFRRLLAAEVCASAVVMLDKIRSEVVWRVLATHSIRQFPFTSPSVRHRVPITFQLESNTSLPRWWILHQHCYCRSAKRCLQLSDEGSWRCVFVFVNRLFNDAVNNCSCIVSNDRTTDKLEGI